MSSINNTYLCLELMLVMAAYVKEFLASNIAYLSHTSDSRKKTLSNNSDILKSKVDILICSYKLVIQKYLYKMFKDQYIQSTEDLIVIQYQYKEGEKQC